MASMTTAKTAERSGHMGSAKSPLHNMSTSSLGAHTSSCVVRPSHGRRRQVRFKSSGQIDGVYACMLLPRVSDDTTMVAQARRDDTSSAGAEKGQHRLNWRIRMKLKARAKKERKVPKLPSESESGSFDSWLDLPTPQRTPIVGSESVACSSGYHCSSSSSSGPPPPQSSSMKRSSLYIESSVPLHNRDIGALAHRRSAVATMASASTQPNRPVPSKVSNTSQPKRSFLRPHHLCLCGRCHVIGGTKAFLVLYAAITLGGMAFGMVSAMVWALIPMLIIPMTAYSLWRCEPKYLYPFLLITVIQMIVSFAMMVIVALFSVLNFETISEIIAFDSPRVLGLAVIVLVVLACLFAVFLFGWQMLVISSCIHFFENHGNRSGRGKATLQTTASDRPTAQEAAVNVANMRVGDLPPPAICTPMVSSSLALERPPTSAVTTSSPEKATPHPTLPCSSHSTAAAFNNSSGQVAGEDPTHERVGEMLLASIEMTTHTIMI